MGEAIQPYRSFDTIEQEVKGPWHPAWSKYRSTDRLKLNI